MNKYDRLIGVIRGFIIILEVTRWDTVPGLASSREESLRGSEFFRFYVPSSLVVPCP